MFTLGEGGKKVLEMLGGYGHVVATYQHRHRYPYDWRTKRPVIIRATEQWFANVGDIKKDALDALDTVDFVPASGKARLRSFVKGRSEWCISRQRAWGVPIPALYHRETGQALLDEDSVGHIMRVLKERGTDAWWTDSEFEGAWIPPALGDASMAKLYRRGKDTMDVWFDSGTSWTQCAPQDLPAPADMYLEGSDQHRGWFQSSLLTYVAHQKTGSAKIAPFKTLVTHGFTLDSKGRKMSKSIGNVISPDEIMTGTLAPPPKKIKKKGDTAAKTSPQRRPSYGPDALRLWVASSDYTKDITIGSEVLREVTTVLRKLRGITKLLLGALDDFDPAHLVRYEDLTQLDRMALLHISKVNEYTRDRYGVHDFSKGTLAHTVS
jgi:isoleucyl-tRNA synthetase